MLKVSRLLPSFLPSSRLSSDNCCALLAVQSPFIGGRATSDPILGENPRSADINVTVQVLPCLSLFCAVAARELTRGKGGEMLTLLPLLLLFLFMDRRVESLRTKGKKVNWVEDRGDELATPVSLCCKIADGQIREIIPEKRERWGDDLVLAPMKLLVLTGTLHALIYGTINLGYFIPSSSQSTFPEPWANTIAFPYRNHFRQKLCLLFLLTHSGL